MADVNPIPEGYPRLSPYLAVDGASDAIEFYKDVFGASERMRMGGPDGKIGHAELQIGDSVLMIADEFPDFGNASPKTIGGSPVTLSLYVEDVDATHAKALSAGGSELRAPENQFYGDRTGSFEDPWGHKWHIASHVEDISAEEMAKRAEGMAPG